MLVWISMHVLLFRSIGKSVLALKLLLTTVAFYPSSYTWSLLHTQHGRRYISCVYATYATIGTRARSRSLPGTTALFNLHFSPSSMWVGHTQPRWESGHNGAWINALLVYTECSTGHAGTVSALVSLMHIISFVLESTSYMKGTIVVYNTHRYTDVLSPIRRPMLIYS